MVSLFTYDFDSPVPVPIHKFAKGDIQVKQQLGSLSGRLHTQSHPIKGKNPVVWYLLADLSEFRTQKIKRSRKYIG